MSRVIAILAMLLAALFAVRWAVNAPPARVARAMRALGGMILLLIAGWLAIRGGWAVAAPLAALGLGLLGSSGSFSGRGGADGTGRTSSVRTRMLLMRLDHGTGRMEGEILSGRFAGRELSGLADAELRVLHDECAAAGDQSLRLLETWLDRERPGWRETWGAGAQGGDAAGDGGGASPDEGPMTPAMAREILGVDENATEEEIRAAHRRLMKAVHPDHGGSDWLARRINEARDVLLRHRKGA